MDDVQSSERKCSDPRDYVFGVLGIAGDAVARQIQVYYEVSLIKLFTHVAMLFLVSSGLGVPSRCQLDVLEESEEGALWYLNKSAELPEVFKFPSWVPMWHRIMPKQFNIVANSEPEDLNYHAPKHFPLDLMLQFLIFCSVFLQGAVVDCAYKLKNWASKNYLDHH